jgi:hypothetical protein
MATQNSLVLLMNKHSIIPWTSSAGHVVPSSARTASEIAGRAVQLRKREVSQIVGAFNSRHYEMACTFIWSKASTALKRRLSSLGSEFIGEMLQRPDIIAGSDVLSTVTDSESITLAEDLGMVTSADAMRLRHAHETINHFANYDGDFDDGEENGSGINEEEAIGCLRVCVNSILGQPRLEVAQDFAEFRRQLEEQTFKSSDEKIIDLLNSPYFFLKTTLSVLLAMLRSGGGAQLEHAVRNTNLIVPLVWNKLKKPEKWQAGQTYAELYADGKKDALNGLKSALSKVSGFDYVPENLRSATFTRAAKEVLEAHQGMNNFYNEPTPMRALAALGTTIPSPAFPVCMTATLCVWLGNQYGHSWAAQDSAMKILKGLSQDRWTYYLDEVLPRDREILMKLIHLKPAERWTELLKKIEINITTLKDQKILRIIKASKEGKIQHIRDAAIRVLDQSARLAA